MDNLERIRLEFEEYGGTFVITDSNRVERFIGIMEDEQDYYYIVWNGREPNLHSCVGSLIKLKGKIEARDYDKLVYIAKLNHYDSDELYQVGSEQYKDYAQKNREAVERTVIGTRTDHVLLAPLNWTIH